MLAAAITAAAAVPAEQCAEFAAIGVERELIDRLTAREEGAWGSAGERDLVQCRRRGARMIAAIALAVAPTGRHPEIDVAGGDEEFTLRRADKCGGAAVEFIARAQIAKRADGDRVHERRERRTNRLVNIVRVEQRLAARGF